MTAPRIVIEQSFDSPDAEKAAAARHGVELSGIANVDAQQFFDAARNADGVIVRFLKLDAAMLEGSRWKVVGRYGIGVDNVDVEAASRLGIAVVNVPDYCVEEVAEHAVALIYAGWRRLRAANDLVLGDRWVEWQKIGSIGRMSGATLGLIGAGRIGSEVVRLLKPAFGRVLVHDPMNPNVLPGTERAELSAVLAESDVVSLHCPLTPETRNLMNAETLGRMKPGSILVNVSRGELIDITALPAALDAGRPALAMLDVLPVEPPAAGAALLRDPRVFQTPHVAWLSSEAITDLRNKVADRSAAYLAGKPVVSIVNANRLERRR
jgi:D-3-phosphoglycerate dehydrogenase